MRCFTSLGVGVIDDGEEHVEEDEENEEHISQEHDGTEDSVGRLQGIEVKVTQDDSEQSETEIYNSLD